MSQYELHDYQKRAIDFAVTKKASFMMLDVGLGKTAIALKAIQHVDIPALVIAPLRVATITWPDEIRKWTPELTYTVMYGPTKDAKLRYKRDIYLLSYSSIAWFFDAVLDGRFRLPQFFFILDESSMIKNPSTKRFKMIRRMIKALSPYRMNLSATPNPNGWHELWPQYYMLDGGARLGKSYNSFRDQFFEYTGPPAYRTMPKKGAQEDITDLIADLTYRLDGRDYLELPAIIYNEVKLKLPQGLHKLYNTLERDLYLKFEKGEVTAFNAASVVMKMRQFLQGALYTTGGNYQLLHNIKVKALKELIEIHSGQPILCAIQFKFEYDMLTKEFGPLPIVAGKTDTRESIYHIRKWNAGQLPILLCHPQSISHGMNLQSGGNIILWYGLTWSYEQYAQLNGRLHRQGQKNAVVVNHLIFQDTIDQVILSALTDKSASQQLLLDTLRERILLNRAN